MVLAWVGRCFKTVCVDAGSCYGNTTGQLLAKEMLQSPMVGRLVDVDLMQLCMHATIDSIHIYHV